MQSPVIQRLKRVRGQIDGLVKMIESDDDCKKVIEQFSAADSALKRAIDVYLRDHLDQCLNKADRKTRGDIEYITSAFINKR